MIKNFQILFGLVLISLVLEQSHGEVIKMLSKSLEKKSSVCPTVKSVSHTCIANNTCTDDSDCSGTLKCCMTDCSRKCVAPAIKKLGTNNGNRSNLKFRKYSSRSEKVSNKCPKFNHTLTDSDCETLNPKSDCETNFDCSYGKRCCFSDCGSRKCIQIKSDSKSKKLSAKRSNQRSTRSFYDFYGDFYGYSDYGNLQKRVPFTYGSRLFPVYGWPRGFDIQTRPINVNQQTLRIAEARNRLPQFNLS